MPGFTMGQRVRVRINYDKGSQTLNNLKSTAEDNELFQVAMGVASLRESEKRDLVKIVESDLLER